MPLKATYFEKFYEYKQIFQDYEKRSPESLLSEILETSKTYIKKDGIALIQEAFSLANRAHTWQTRKTGNPYITHPLTVACMMLPYSPCEKLIAATLLHDTLEDTDITYEKIAQLDPEVAHIVEWATKIRKVSVHRTDEEHSKFETIRKILIASKQDIRILYLKIFDRLHNMITLGAKSQAWQIRIAEETKSVYVPLAKRSWLREIHHLLHGSAMEVLEPEKWQVMRTLSENHKPIILARTEKIHKYLQEHFWSESIETSETLFLSPFSLDQKQIFHEDIWFSIQIIAKDVESCSDILRDIGLRYDENFLQVGRVTNLINQPRLSSYQWLHFDVIFEWIHRIKIHVLTRETYERINHPINFNELGKIYSPVLFRDFDLINEATSSDSEDFMKSVTEHILARKIPLHSASRHLFYLPIKSTALDAAIYLHPEKFHTLEMIYKNNEKVPLHTPLENDDILTFSFWEKSTIEKKWEEYVHSGISIWRIEQYF